MKKALIALSLYLLLASPALAIEATRSGRNIERLEQMEQKREAARLRVRTIRDENKQKIAEHINQQLVHISDRAVKHFNNILERMRQLLEKIKTRAPAVDITAAQTAIDLAQAAVDDLANNIYVIEFTNESGLRVGASTAKTQLRTDIKAVREKVRLARQAVVNVLKAAKAL
ncbi:MAG: hypothetical protein U1C50_01695 [Patescibacteria group bacterium]|nr:hypothetical protein [Candidatus Beckwithbacteria bacterium]MDZ4228947.1 hypothetical protein [Patescibacteria group bacterium]